MHPYLRAYLAGIALPTMVVPLVVVGLSLHHAKGFGLHLADVVIFPVGLVPNAWGLWNMIHVWLRNRRDVPIGLFGAALVVILVPVAYGIQLALGNVVWTSSLFAVGFPVTIAVYYLAWKYGVARVNDSLGIG